MLSSLFRLAMLAGSGAGMAAGMRRTAVRIACLLVAVIVSALLVVVGIGAFGFALYVALLPEVGPAWGAVAAGGLLIVLAGAIVLIGWYRYSRRPRRSASGSDLGGSLGAAALGASMGSIPDLDLRGALERNAITVLLAAFVAGMVMNNRR